MKSTQPRNGRLICQLPRASRGNESFNSQDFSLNLETEWFAKAPPVLPLSVTGAPGEKSHASTMGRSSSGPQKSYHYSAVVQDNTNLAHTKIHLTWDGASPGLTVKAQQRHYPPPPQLSRNELEACRQQYSEAVARWCESKIGHQVGNGECWTLARDALLAVAVQCKPQGQEPCMASQSYIHGQLIYSFNPSKSSYSGPRGGVLDAGVARGDVMQFWKAHFKAKDGRSSSYAGDPDHTAVVTRVDADGVCRVLEQNTGGVKRVGDGKYDMSELIKGEVKIYRAVGERWIAKLDLKW